MAHQLVIFTTICGAGNDLGGRIVAVDLAPRCLRDLTHLAKSRPGLVPVLGDARKHAAWGFDSSQGKMVVSRCCTIRTSRHIYCCM